MEMKIFVKKQRKLETKINTKAKKREIFEYK